MPASGWPEGLRKLGLERPIDLLLHFPLRYEDESEVWPIARVASGQSVQLQVRVRSAKVVFRPRRTLLVEVEDETGRASLRYFYFKQSMVDDFTEGREIRVIGESRLSLAGLEFVHPKVRSGWLSPEALASQPMLPVYPTTQGLAQATIRRQVVLALQKHLPEEWLPQAFLSVLGLRRLPEAIETLHRAPAAVDGIRQSIDEQGPEWNRIRVDELLAQQIALRRARRSRANDRAFALNDAEGLADQLLKLLPFVLTAAQKRSWQELRSDLTQERPAHRLIQGDVGSGKTVIAALAAAHALGSGSQVAVMAPTEILAAQLHSKFSEWMSALGIEVLFLKGGLAASERRRRHESVASGACRLVVGTHALIQKDVVFKSLGLAIVDEQHRFGVAQRIALREQQSAGHVAHIVGMSATPIPRSLAMTYLADLDVSVIDERPPGRKPIQTRLVSRSRREEVLDRLVHFLESEGQAYWVCPIIDEKEDAERAYAALSETEAWLRPTLGEKLQVLHGRMPAAEKAQAMARFVAGQARLLLATTVIEVGVDVPAARLMVIEQAERFGLAQLHQLRGRVGRGQGQSSCILMFEEPLSETARERLRALYETDDGFELARRDLAMRGPGELLGVRQSGEPSLRFSDLSRDQRLIEYAVDWAERHLNASGDLLSGANVSPEQIEALLNRWAHGRDRFLASV